MAEFDLNQDELLATFADEAVDEIAALENGLLALENAPHDAELRRDLLRYAHTLKGNASCLGLQAFTTFAHAYEEMLERIHDDEVDVDHSLVTLLLSGIDTFRRLLGGSDTLTDDDHQLMATLSTDRQESAVGVAQTLLSVPSRPAARAVRVSAERLNRMLDLAGEISIARGRVQQLLTAKDSFDDLQETERELDFLHGELQELIMRARMVPVGPLFRQYTRTVRDLASAHGKNARLVTTGDDVEIDTTAVELLRDPLTHMIRNSIDHGLEPSSQRIASGKPPVGTITLEAHHEAGSVIIRVSDDGAGLDRAAIAARGTELGLDTGRLTESEIDQLIFESGFSTSDSVTDLSGRGVGMDVVRRGIESLRGTIRIESNPGHGTTFTIRLPLTLAVIDGFGVTAAGETYIVPLDHVLECIEVPESEGKEKMGGMLLVRNELIPYVRLRSRFGLLGAGNGRENILVVQHDGAKAGLVVDELHGAAQAVIKPLGSFFQELPGIAGSSILGDGRVALILDVPAVLRSMNSSALEVAV